MKKTYPIYILYIGFSFLMVVGSLSCRQNGDATSIGNPLSIPVVDFLEITELLDTEKLGETEIDLFVENKTEDCIVFKHDYGIQIYTISNNTWEQIPNLVEYMNSDDITLTNASGNLPFAIVHIFPDYSKLQKQPDRIRVILQAKLCHNGVPIDKMVSDFVDIELEK